MGGISYTAHISQNKSAITSKTKLEGVAKHNLRKYKSTDYSADKIILLYGTNNLVRDVKRVYKEAFGNAVKKYNEKQNREDRKIKDYFNYVSEKGQDMAVEIIFQCGDKEFWDAREEDKKLMEAVYQKILIWLQIYLPDYKIANAVVHLDETSPHMHVVGVPVGRGFKNGPETKVSKRSVFTKETLSVVLQDKLRKVANDYTRLYLRENIREKEKGRNHDLSVAEYKVAKEIEKYEQIKEECVNTEKEVEALKEEAVYTKKEVEVLKEQAREAEDRAEQAQQVYELIKYDSEASLRARCIDAIVENQQLKEDNAMLRESLRKAYDFMEKMVIDGKNMLERFMESLTRKTEKIIDEWRIIRR